MNAEKEALVNVFVQITLHAISDADGAAMAHWSADAVTNLATDVKLRDVWADPEFQEAYKTALGTELAKQFPGWVRARSKDGPQCHHLSGVLDPPVVYFQAK